MNVEDYRKYCILKKAVTESFPFDDNTLVFKVKNKMFALLSLKDSWVNLKCDPAYAIELREKYKSILPGYHMNKKHWNTIEFNNDIDDKIIYELTDHSYDLIVKNLPKKDRIDLNQ